MDVTGGPITKENPEGVSLQPIQHSLAVPSRARRLLNIIHNFTRVYSCNSCCTLGLICVYTDSSNGDPAESWLADLLHVVTDLSSPLAPQQQQRPCWPEAPEVDHFIFVNGGYPQRTVIVESHRLSEFFPGAIQSDLNQPRFGVRSHLLVCLSLIHI